MNRILIFAFVLFVSGCTHSSMNDSNVKLIQNYLWVDLMPGGVPSIGLHSIIEADISFTNFNVSSITLVQNQIELTTWIPQDYVRSYDNKTIHLEINILDKSIINSLNINETVSLIYNFVSKDQVFTKEYSDITIEKVY